MIERTDTARTCEAVRDHLTDHIQGRSGRLADRIARHLEGCEACRQRAAFIRAMIQAGEQRQPGPRLGFERRLEQVVAQAEGRTEDRAARRAAWGAAGISAVIVALFGGVLPDLPATLGAIWSAATTSPLLVAGSAAGLLVLSAPVILARSIRRMEETR